MWLVLGVIARLSVSDARSGNEMGRMVGSSFHFRVDRFLNLLKLSELDWHRHTHTNSIFSVWGMMYFLARTRTALAPSARWTTAAATGTTTRTWAPLAIRTMATEAKAKTTVNVPLQAGSSVEGGRGKKPTAVVLMNMGGPSTVSSE